MSDVVVVLGMHRSGTSAISGVLTKLGGAAPKHSIPPDPGNAHGYFESALFMHFHDELLASGGSYWHDWRKFNPAWYRSLVVDAYKKRAKEIFEAEFDDALLPILKDPRICRLVPFWVDVLKEMEAAPRIIIPIRSPLEVAHSLKKREAMPLTKGLLLWLRHVLDAEAQTRSIARSIFTWDQFVSDWRRISDKISLDIGLSWPRLSDRSAHEIEQFLSSELVHNKTDHAELIVHSDVHEWTIGAYEALLELARNPSSNFASERLDGIRELFEQSSAMFGRVLTDYEIGLEDLQAQAHASRSENDLLRGQLVEVRTELAAILAERTVRLEQAEAALAAVQSAHDEALEKNIKIETDLGWTRAEKEKMEAAHTNALAETKSMFESQISALHGQLIDAEVALAKSSATRRSRGIWAKILPSAVHSYRLECKLIRSGLFDADWYRSEYPEVAEMGRRAARHYLEEGYCRGYRPNPFFDTRWYLEQYEDVRRSRMNPLLHYAMHGYREGRDPSPLFKTSFYLETYPEIRESGVNPLVHYIHHGRKEGRPSRPPVGGD